MQAQDRERVDDPPECHWPAEEHHPDKWKACADAATIGSPAHVLASMNLGSQAFLAGDWAAAAGFYDQTFVDGQSVTSDVFLHAYRASTYEHVGRLDQALADALVVFTYIERGHTSFASDSVPLTDEMRAHLYPFILATLVRAGDPKMHKAISAFALLPVTNWLEAANRAATFTEIGRYKDALPFSEQVLQERPDDPMILNNHCYLLALMGDGEAAVPFCERALAAMPGEAGIYDSLAVALSAAGRCEEGVAARKSAAEIDPSAAGYREKLACEGER